MLCAGRGLPIDVREVCAAGSAAVEDEEDVSRGMQDDVAEGGPGEGGDWLVAFTGHQGQYRVQKLPKGARLGEAGLKAR